MLAAITFTVSKMYKAIHHIRAFVAALEHVPRRNGTYYSDSAGFLFTLCAMQIYFITD